ncbi:transcriptional regulator [Paenibacillus sp. DRB1-1]|uniref:transcriptional regulator n=1 Tax=Paenibacillus sp. DRB1-1 TaxID=3422309 RepID=UPI003F9D34A3
MRHPHFHSKNYGGARPGSGRKKIGKSKALRITLPDADWEHIDGLIASGRVASYAEYFRELHESSLTKFLEV